jgi:hypothetical protein
VGIVTVKVTHSSLGSTIATINVLS